VTITGEVDTKMLSVVCEGSPKWTDVPLVSCLDTNQNVRVTFSIIKAQEGIFQAADFFTYATLDLGFVASWNNAPVTATPTAYWNELKLNAIKVDMDDSGNVNMIGSISASNVTTPIVTNLSINYEFAHVPCGTACK
jgi:hypothetical protein